jgi:hypothetical protein
MIFHFKFTIEEIKVLNSFFSHQYISCENMSLLELVRKLQKIEEEHDMVNGTSKPT